MDRFFENFNAGNYQQCEAILASEDIDQKEQLTEYYNMMVLGKFRQLGDVLSKKEMSTNSSFDYLNSGIALYAKYGLEKEAFMVFERAIEESKKSKNKFAICEVLKFSLEIYERLHLNSNDKTYEYLSNELLQNAYNKELKLLASLFKYRIYQRYNFENIQENIKTYKSQRGKLKDLKNPLNKAKRDLTYYVHHQNFTKNNDSATFFLERAIFNLSSTRGYLERERLIAAQINEASKLYTIGEYEAALRKLNNIELIEGDYIFRLLNKFIFFKQSEVYNGLGDELNSLRFENKFLYEQELQKQAQNQSFISNLETKYQTAEKEKQILIEQSQKIKNRNIAYALAGSLLLLSIIATLLYRNTKRKQRIAEQEKELETQKTATLLKEQEITTINAMVEGQEKERLRLARDLHDNLGGTLAAVKMHIGNLQLNLHKSENPQELLDKADVLISEAYKNVRSIAHERNSGVMAKEGLLPAIKKLAQKVSVSNGLSIEVRDFGLEQRLHNSLEINIFRMIQELVTNVIKHAQATELQISLTQHKDELNIVVEDNGKGFKVGKLKDKDGMGLGSIERRVEHLEGSMLVDSTPEKGTNIIIDIPI